MFSFPVGLLFLFWIELLARIRQGGFPAFADPFDYLLDVFGVAMATTFFFFFSLLLSSSSIRLDGNGGGCGNDVKES